VSAHFWETDLPPQSVRKHGSKNKRSRAELLAEIADLPSDAFIPTAHAAAYIGSTPAVMGSWRSQRRGPRYYGADEFIRYTLSDLDQFMATRANEIPEIENAERLARTSTAA
jgi:hypothetical protein